VKRGLSAAARARGTEPRAGSRHPPAGRVPACAGRQPGADGRRWPCPGSPERNRGLAGPAAAMPRGRA